MSGLEGAWSDLKYAFRSARRHRTFSMGVVATLAIGIGAASTIFALIDAAVLRPLPSAEADRLVRLETRYATGESQLAFPDSYRAWRAETSLFAAVSAHRLEFMNLTGGEGIELAPLARVTASFFEVFPAAPAAGTVFGPDEDRPGGPRLAVLSAAFGVRRFGGAADAIGRTIDLNGVPYVVIGVLASRYDSQQFDPPPEVWVPLQYEIDRKDGSDYSTVTARLRPGVTVAGANAGLAVAYAAAYPAAGTPSASRTTWAAVPLREAMVEGARSMLWLVSAAVGLVLLVACANVANLLLVRAEARKREVAIRRTIGAGWGRIFRLSLMECGVLSLVGGVLGLIVGLVGVRGVLAIYPPTNPFNAADGASAVAAILSRGGALRLNGHVVAFAAAVSAVAAIVLGLLTSIAMAGGERSRARKRSAGREGRRPRRGRGASRGRFRAAIVVSEVAVALMLVAGAALLIRTSWALLSVEPGFEAERLLTMRMSAIGTPFEHSEGMTSAAAALAELRTVPGVQAAGIGCCMPLETVWQLPFVIEGRPPESLTRRGNLAFTGFGGWTFVTPGYFEALKIPLLRGRAFMDSDVAGAPGVVVINRAMAEKFWPNADPLGQWLRIGKGMGPQFDKDEARVIVGIVGDVRDQGLDRAPRPAMYVPMAQLPDEILVRQARLLPLVWFVRTRVAPYSLGDRLARAIERASGGVPVARVRSMQEVVSESTARTRFDMLLMTLFAGISLLLAAVGVYGVIAYIAEQRTREVGIRMALGAPAAGIRALLVKQGMRLAAAGVIVGVIGALALSRLLAGLLFGVSSLDPLAFTVAALVVGSAAFLATLLPALRASRVDPAVALRSE